MSVKVKKSASKAIKGGSTATSKKIKNKKVGGRSKSVVATTQTEDYMCYSTMSQGDQGVMMFSPPPTAPLERSFREAAV